MVASSSLVQPGDLDAHLHAQRRVEVGERLVEQEHLGLAHDRAADGDALALAAGELPWACGRSSVLELQDARPPRRPCASRSVLRRAGERAARSAMLSRDRHVRIERVGLEHHGDAALGRRHVVDALPSISRSPAVISSSPAIMRSSVDLPQPDGPTKTHELAVVDLEVDALDDLDVAEALADVA